MIAWIPCLLLLVGSALASHIQYRYDTNDSDPFVGGGSDQGWQIMPEVGGATSYPQWPLDPKGRAKLPVYQTTGLVESEITRAVIVLPGKPRDCWYYWVIMNNALVKANAQNSSIDPSQISIMAPCFWTELDVQAGAAQSDVLVFGLTTWIDGKENVGPSTISKYSSFRVLDDLIAYYMDRIRYPNLNTVVLAGHSAGGQMVQRYAGLRRANVDDDRLHFWVANPGSLMWLSPDRPYPNASCEGIDDYKYGLAGNFPWYGRGLDRDSITPLYNQRIINYAWGTADNGPGDTRCEAETQGSTHLTRGQNFVQMINSTFGWPANATVDWVLGVSHDNVGMMESDDGIDKASVW
ncbi:hypothetical protein GYMLUDRAFT_175314 [Collybiopsis luxurians FD-317 M1]|uniref:Uncharacterized protein n=1 Tax=Collybiopsis luxurians FD-317 M1 TaxID=944289 RepID=A0A0D0CC66_9AGAR|nr:hypothetical protein GYMLUDRAFT_175314 [Collybiopsis luxurians FD-317 M1]